MTLNSQYLMSSLFASLWVLALSTADICSFHSVGKARMGKKHLWSRLSSLPIIKLSFNKFHWCETS